MVDTPHKAAQVSKNEKSSSANSSNAPNVLQHAILQRRRSNPPPPAVSALQLYTPIQKIFRAVAFAPDMPPASETFYIRSERGSALWYRSWNKLGFPKKSPHDDDVTFVSVEPFDAAFLWRYCPFDDKKNNSKTASSDSSPLLCGGLLVSAVDANICLAWQRFETYQPIKVRDATHNDLWVYDAKEGEWSCPRGKMMQNLCDHVTVAGKTAYRHWTESRMQNVSTKAVNDALTHAKITWDQTLTQTPDFILS